jgi:hypothetical protein
MYTVKSLNVLDVVRVLRHGEIRVALRISRTLVKHSLKSTPVRLRYGTRRLLLRAAGRLA